MSIEMLPRWLRQLATDISGNAAIEFAFVAPLLLLLPMAVLQLTLWGVGAAAARDAADRAARCVMVDPRGCDSEENVRKTVAEETTTMTAKVDLALERADCGVAVVGRQKDFAFQGMSAVSVRRCAG